MSISGSGWVPQLSSSLQQQLNNLENGQTSLVASGVSNAAKGLFQDTVMQAMPIVSEQNAVQTEVSSLTSLSGALQSLQSAIQKLASNNTWNATTASSSNTNAFTVTSSDGAPQTSVQVSVQSLAKGQISLTNMQNATADGATTITAGSIGITGGLGSATVSVQAGDSLNTIAQDINQASDKTGVQASIMQNAGSYQLMLTSTQTGSTKGALSIDTTTTTSTFGGQAIALASTIQSASDASITLGGSSGVSVTSETNTFQNAIPNTTITAVSAGTSATGTVTINGNPQATVDAMTQFFDAYNKVESLVYTGGSAASTTIGKLIAIQMPSLVSEQASTGTNGLDSLSQVGVMTNPGTYSLSDGSLSSTGAPALGFESTSGLAGVSLPSGVTLPDGKTTFKQLMQTQPQDLKNLLGVTSSGLKLQQGSILGDLSNSIKTWMNDLNGTTQGTTKIPGEISNLQKQLTTGSAALPGTYGYRLNQLQQQYSQQVENLISRWNAASASMMQAQSQYSQLQAVTAMSQSSVYQTGSLLGG